MEIEQYFVSTHSRLKAAGSKPANHTGNRKSFNTQPPEGGWGRFYERCWLMGSVSTHSRLKAAGYPDSFGSITQKSFNTQPPEGGWADKPKQTD